MLPLENGGVVDPALRVYGTQNLRVADTSIFPLIPAAHLQAVVYAVAEKVGLPESQTVLKLVPDTDNLSVGNRQRT